MTLQVVADTNIFISALLWGGTPGRVMQAFITGDTILLLSTDILNELERKLKNDKFAPRMLKRNLTPEQAISDVREIAKLVTPVDVPDDAVRDPKDRIILACAVGGNADPIISGDQDLTTLGMYSGIPILTPAQFREKLSPTAEA